MPVIVQLSISECDVIKTILEFLEMRGLHIAQVFFTFSFIYGSQIFRIFSKFFVESTISRLVHRYWFFFKAFSITGLMLGSSLAIEVQVNRKHHADFWIDLLLRGVEPQHRRSELSSNPLNHSMLQFISLPIMNCFYSYNLKYIKKKLKKFYNFVKI